MSEAGFAVLEERARAAGLTLTAWVRIAPDPHLRATLAGTLRLVCALLLPVALVTPPLFWLVDRVPVSQGRAGRRMVAYLAGFVPFAALLALLRWLLLPAWYPHSGASGGLHAPEGLAWAALADQLVLYLALVGAAHARACLRRLRRSELAEAELREALAQSELETLQAQLQPHLLFNTLNGISALLHSDPARAEQIILRLSSLLRRTLRAGGSDLVPLSDELRLVEDYLEIESVRLGERLCLRWQIEERARGELVPRFMLQLLVENAVKHGIANSRPGGWLEVRAGLAGRALTLRVRNSVSAEPEQGLGLGHRNIRTRLELLYGGRGRFAFERSRDEATAILELPLMRGLAEDSNGPSGMEADELSGRNSDEPSARRPQPGGVS